MEHEFVDKSYLLQLLELKLLHLQVIVFLGIIHRDLYIQSRSPDKLSYSRQSRFGSGIVTILKFVAVEMLLFSNSRM